MKKCPYPIGDDNGSVKQCVQRGHCGCYESDKVLWFSANEIRMAGFVGMMFGAMIAMILGQWWR